MKLKLQIRADYNMLLNQCDPGPGTSLKIQKDNAV